jgi:spermidine/putrescine transport system substrate-binding protein
VVFHPREGFLTRRDFLKRSAAAGLALGSAGTLLAACGSSSPKASGQTGGSTVPLPRPGSPVRWPVFTDNEPIASGLPPESGATLQIYNWVAYINPTVVSGFEKKFGCKCTVTTFNTMTEALAKLQTGEIPFDIFFPTVDVLGPLVEAKLVRPVNHSYVPNIVNAWSEFTNPFYDEGWLYTVPYTIYTTGMAWRKDHVSENPYDLASGWDLPWISSKYKGRVAVLDDYREGISLGLMHNGVFDLNTTDATQLAAARQSLQELQQLVSVRIDNNDYTDVPDGKTWIHHAWSGDMATAAQYMSKGTPVDVVGYWFPPDGKGPVANDTIVTLTSGKNPVLAHEFLNYMLDVETVFDNISYNGYMQPLEAVTPQKLVADGLLPETLISTAVLPSYFDRGVSELELSPAATSTWEQEWSQFSEGL